MNPDGIVNAAPFSMFNMMGEEPPIVMISINRLKNGELKDTSANILRTGEFVVHLADEAIAEKMHLCGERLPPNEASSRVVGLTPVPSPPGAATADCRSAGRVRMHAVGGDCKPRKSLHLHRSQRTVPARSRHANRYGNVAGTLMQDYFPVARFGASFYIKTRDRFTIG